MSRAAIATDAPTGFRSGVAEDQIAWLTGRWTVARTINGIEGIYLGEAEFVDDGAGGLHWREAGELHLHDHVGRVCRTLHVSPAGEVAFDDGRPFHPLDLSTGHDAPVHLCGPDTYRGRFIVEGPDVLRTVWRVTGPGRDDTIASEYRRAARSPGTPPDG